MAYSRKDTVRLTIINGGRHKEVIYPSYTDRPLYAAMGAAEAAVYGAGAEYARVDYWHDGLNDWAVYAEYES